MSGPGSLEESEPAGIEIAGNKKARPKGRARPTVASGAAEV
jgi:hypothetical protein